MWMGVVVLLPDAEVSARALACRRRLEGCSPNLLSLSQYYSSTFLSGKDLAALATSLGSGARKSRKFSMQILANAAQVLDDVAAPRKEEMTVVDVDLGDRSYPIYIGKGLLNQPELLQKHVHGKKVLIDTNETIAPLYLSRVVAALKNGGNNVEVESVILPDGEQHKNMVDSSVGGKTGVNHPLGKNMIGAFYQPQCVLVDTDSLSTLPDRELASGVGEVIKYGLVRDAEFFEWQEQNMEKLLAGCYLNYLSCSKAKVLVIVAFSH